MGADLRWLDATAQVELVERGEASPAELVEAAIARIEEHNPALNAVIHLAFAEARAASQSAELPRGPLRGVPILGGAAVVQRHAPVARRRLS
jgi:amidase